MESNSDTKQVQDAVDEKSPLVKETVQKYNQMDANKDQVKIHEGIDEVDERSAIVTEKVEPISDGATEKPKCKRLQGIITRIRNFLKSFRCW